MADGDDDIFVYLGGEQGVPGGVTHAVIDPSVNIVQKRAFMVRQHLVSVIFHDGVEIIEEIAFLNCHSLSGINLLGVREIKGSAFKDCFGLSGVEFGDKLEIIGKRSFQRTSLRSIKMSSVRSIEDLAFSHCMQLTDVEFGIDLRRIGCGSFSNCPHLHRIVIPLKQYLFPFDFEENRYTQFDRCHNLTTVELVGAEGLHKTISSLLMDSWRDEMNEEIDRINQQLPNTNMNEKTNAIRLWVRSVINRMDHYKAEHNRLLKEHITQLELAIWKTKLDEKEDNCTQKVQAKRAKIDEERARGEKRITSGADIIIKNVLPFLKLE